jgi:uncharacterized DUF497 family protein
MDEYFELNGIPFVWDQMKARKNVKKHGVTFYQAAEAFFDPFFLVIEASPKEDVRDAIIGMDKRWNLLFVVHACVEEERIRIISARKVSRLERKLYEN